MPDVNEITEPDESTLPVEETPEAAALAEAETEPDENTGNAHYSTSELLDGLQQSDAENLTYRAALETAGYTFADDGSLIPPPVAAPPVAPAASIAPPIPAAAVAAPPAAVPDHYKDTWTVAADGNDLHEPVMEDISSAESVALRERIGDAEFARLQGEYQRDKFEYARHVETRDATTISDRMPAFFEAANSEQGRFQAMLQADDGVSEAASAAIAAHYRQAASVLLGQAQINLAEHYVAQGVPRYRANQRSLVEITSDPSLVEQAFGEAIAADVAGFIKQVKAAVKSGGAADVPTTPAAVPAANSRPPIPAINGARGSAPVLPVNGTVKPTAEEIAFAKNLGVDPVKFASYNR